MDWQDFRAPHMLGLLAFLQQVPAGGDLHFVTLPAWRKI